MVLYSSSPQPVGLQMLLNYNSQDPQPALPLGRKAGSCSSTTSGDPQVEDRCFRPVVPNQVASGCVGLQLPQSHSQLCHWAGKLGVVVQQHLGTHGLRTTDIGQWSPTWWPLDVLDYNSHNPTASKAGCGIVGVVVQHIQRPPGWGPLA